MRKYVFVLTLLGIIQVAKSQTVLISDNDLYTRMSYYCPSATIGGNLLETSDPCLATVTEFSTQGIGVSSLDGLQYFTGLTAVYLDYGDNLSETDIQFIPPGVTNLQIQGNNFTSLSVYPPNLEILGVNNNSVTSITNLPTGLTHLGLSNLNSLTTIDAFPNTLTNLDLNTISITSIPSLPSSILNITMWFTTIPTIDLSNAANLSYLEIYYSDLSTIDLSGCSSLTQFGINGCQITSLSYFPPLVTDCVLSQNNLQTLGAFPPNLLTIYLNDNPLLENLPTFPASLQGLTIANTSVTCIPNRADLEANHLGMNDFDAVTFPVCTASNLIFIPNTAIVDEIALLCPSSVVNQNFIDTTDACYLNMKSLTLNFLVSDMTGMSQLNHLDSLFISQLDELTTLDQNIPSGLVYLKMNEAYSADFTNLPASLKEIVMLYGDVQDADFQSSNLEKLTIENASASNQYYYPATMKYIDFCPYGYNWSMINELPEGFESIYIDTSFISCLYNLPQSLFVHIGDTAFTDLVFGDTTLLQCSPLDYLGLIPDAGFRQYIFDQDPSVLNGNYLDTIHPFVWNLDSIDLSGYTVLDLEGIQYFKSLKYLNAPYVGLQSIPSFPDSLITLNLNHNQLSSVPDFPENTMYIYLNRNNISSLPILPDTLMELEVSDNQLTILPSLPPYLEVLRADSNNLSSLGTLPDFLNKLTFSHNSVTQMSDTLPYLHTLNAEHNLLTVCPILDTLLTHLNLGNNQISILHALGNNLQILNVDSNTINHSILIPNSLIIGDFTNNQIDTLDISANTLMTELHAGENPNLRAIDLPNSLILVDLSNTNLDSCISFPANLNFLDLSGNVLSELNLLPQNLMSIDISNNPVGCLPVLPNSLEDIYYANTYIGCFPNYPTNPGFTDFSQPLCSEFSYSPCIGLPVLKGEVFLDIDQDGIKDSLETNLPNIPVLFQPGNYSVTTDSLGWFTIQLDTNTSYTMSVTANFYTTTVVPTGIVTGGLNHLDTLTPAGIYNDSTVNELSAFIIQGATPPRPGFKSNKYISVNSTGTDTLDVLVTATLDPIYQILNYSPAPDSIVGGVAYWNLIEFVPGSDFNITVEDSTPVSVPLGTITLNTVQAFPITNDFTEYNNSDTLIQDIVGSYDPNDKSVSTDSILITNLDQTNLKYLIRFQNTGTYPATFVVLKDTISDNLDLNTFTPIAASHDYTFQFQERVLTVRFDNINLMDSTTNEEESHGFFSYAIEPIQSLLPNDEILNTCYIFFDYNDPIITNTTQTTIVNQTFNSISNVHSSSLQIWPNPGMNNFYMDGIQMESELRITDFTGKLVYRQIVNTKRTEINTEKFVSGIYMIELISERGIEIVKWVKL